MQLEWLKAHARVLRWEEELKLIPEEIRRSIAFFEWKATQWERRSTQREGSIRAEVLEGLAGYAHRQARISRALATSGAKMWAKIQKDMATQKDDRGGTDHPSATSVASGTRTGTANRKSDGDSGDNDGGDNGDNNGGDNGDDDDDGGGGDNDDNDDGGGDDDDDDDDDSGNDGDNDDDDDDNGHDDEAGDHGGGGGGDQNDVEEAFVAFLETGFI